MIKRQLAYYIPLVELSQTIACQVLIAQRAIDVNANCLVTYEHLHTARATLSTMVVTLVVDIDKCDYVHRAMQSAIAGALKLYSPETDVVHVSDTPVTTRDFNVQEIL